MPNNMLDLDNRKMEFRRSVRHYRLVSISAFALAGVAMLAIMACLIPFHVQLETFFNNRVGGERGDALRGLSIAVIASPPMIAFIFWMRRRPKLKEPRCVNCSESFAAVHRAEVVVRENKCTKCDTIVFHTNVSDAPPPDNENAIR